MRQGSKEKQEKKKKARVEWGIRDRDKRSEQKLNAYYYMRSSLKTKKDEKKTGSVCLRLLPTGSVRYNHSPVLQATKCTPKKQRARLHLDIHAALCFPLCDFTACVRTLQPLG